MAECSSPKRKVRGSSPRRPATPNGAMRHAPFTLDLKERIATLDQIADLEDIQTKIEMVCEALRRTL